MKVKLIDRVEVADHTMAFRWAKPEGFGFKAGQSVDMTLIEPPETDAEGNTRAFSIASAPQEPFLMTATRMRDTAFKRVLGKLPVGTEVNIEGPFGDFNLHNNVNRPAVILAGGIGITPFRSMVVHAGKEKLKHRIFLFYSNRRRKDAAFLDELEMLQKENSNYKLIAIMSDESGHINKDMLDRYAPDRSNAIYYIAGPPGMVSGLREMLAGAGVDSDDVRSEEFSGY